MNRDEEPIDHEEAARLVREEPALRAEPTGPEDGNPGTDDDATTPDRAVSDAE
jgi:hypothetical protein